MADIVMIKAWVPDAQALQQIVSTAQVQSECGTPKQDADGNYIVTLYATHAEAQKLKALPYKFEMDEQFGDYLEKRQQEVSKTDRFQGGKIKPQGLGTKK
jgi:hypothetical protein